MKQPLPALVDRPTLQRELGVSYHVADAIMRSLPIVRPTHVRKVYVRREDVRRYLAEATLKPEPQPEIGGSVSAWIRIRVTGQGEKRYMVEYRIGGRNGIKGNANTFRTMKEARARRDLVAGWLAIGLNPKGELAKLLHPEPTRSLAEWFEAFVDSRIDVASKTRKSYVTARDRILPVLGDLAPEQIRPSQVQEWIASCADLRPGTIAHYRSVLRQVLDHADVEPNPARSRKVRLPADTAEEPMPPSSREWALIRAQLEPPKLLPLRLMECEGLRISEAIGLTFGDVDFPAGRIRISRARTKGRTAGQRWLPVPAELLDEIAELNPAVTQQRDRRVFVVADHTVRYALRDAAKAAGVPHYHPHDLRHRRISLWFAHGLDPIAIKTWAGHAKASMSSDLYAHVVTEPHLDEWRDFWIEAYRAERMERRGLAVAAVEGERG